MYWLVGLLLAPVGAMLSAMILAGPARDHKLCNCDDRVCKGTGRRENGLLYMLAAAGGVALLFFALLAGGVFVVWNALPFARTPAEQAAYAVFCVLSLIYLAPQFIREVRRLWRYCTVLGSLDADIAARRHF